MSAIIQRDGDNFGDADEKTVIMMMMMMVMMLDMKEGTMKKLTVKCRFGNLASGLQSG